MKLTFFGSSLLSAYWNGAATYYRGICKALHALGHDIVFVEHDIYERQAHRDLLNDPPYAAVHVVNVEGGRKGLDDELHAARASDWVFVCSGIGANDDYIQERALELGGAGGPRISFWDVDAPFNLQHAFAHPADLFSQRIPAWDHIFTYGGGPLVVQHYRELGAQAVSPIYNAVDPAEYQPVPPDPALACDLLLMANRMPDREERVQSLFMRAALLVPDAKFVLGGNGWGGAARPPNVEWIGHVPTADHARRNCSARLVLNVNRAAMAAYGYSPPTRVFEAAGNAACLITDAWVGIDYFLEPGREVLVAQDAGEIAHYVRTISPAQAHIIGQAGHARVLRDHTYEQRARDVDEIIRSS